MSQFTELLMQHLEMWSKKTTIIWYGIGAQRFQFIGYDPHEDLI